MGLPLSYAIMINQRIRSRVVREYQLGGRLASSPTGVSDGRLKMVYKSWPQPAGGCEIIFLQSCLLAAQNNNFF